MRAPAPLTIPGRSVGPHTPPFARLYASYNHAWSSGCTLSGAVQRGSSSHRCSLFLTLQLPQGFAAIGLVGL